MLRNNNTHILIASRDNSHKSSKSMKASPYVGTLFYVQDKQL